MTPIAIESIATRDARYRLASGQGSDAIHNTEEWANAVALLRSTDGLEGWR